MARNAPPEHAAGPAVAERPYGSQAPLPSDDRGFFGHPRGLSTLFFTEMWERFSYYGLRPLLILFMTAALAEGGFGFDARPGVGDRRHLRAPASTWRRSPAGGSPTGCSACGAPSARRGAHHLRATSRSALSASRASKAPFFLGLMLIVLGTGLLKPNISAIVGDLYPEGGARRDAGFSIFYMGINLGALLRPARHRLPGREGRLALGLRRGRRRHADRPDHVRRPRQRHARRPRPRALAPSRPGGRTRGRERTVKMVVGAGARGHRARVRARGDRARSRSTRRPSASSMTYVLGRDGRAVLRRTSSSPAA